MGGTEHQTYSPPRAAGRGLGGGALQKARLSFRHDDLLNALGIRHYFGIGEAQNSEAIVAEPTVALRVPLLRVA